MLSTLIEKIEDAPRESLFLAVVLVVIGGLLSAMYMVCDAQTRQAHQRQALLETQRLAVLDCLSSDPHTSYAACRLEVAQRFAPQGEDAMSAEASTGQTSAHQVTMLVPVAYYALR
ncbi:MAG: hypothetical protein KIS62_06580 [Ramlibacter sp.]|nr:hypothetical protein [Ramlibacter sp.]MBX3657175.1 hypothetical protein [Ramlibacter sp.]MCW5649389.1 hypothetical protein [Ramlibacter sp.]